MSKDDKHIPVIGWFQPHAPYNWDGLVLDKKTGELVKEPSATKQSFVAECDINNIVREFTHTGQVAHINEKAALGAFIDLPDTTDYQQAVELARAGQVAFDQLPAQVRARFGNDPAQFLDFMGDPANQQEAIDLGLAVDNRPPVLPEATAVLPSPSGPEAALPPPTAPKGS